MFYFEKSTCAVLNEINFAYYFCLKYFKILEDFSIKRYADSFLMAQIKIPWSNLSMIL